MQRANRELKILLYRITWRIRLWSFVKAYTKIIRISDMPIFKKYTESY